MTARQVAREVLWWAAIVPPVVRGVRHLWEAATRQPDPTSAARRGVKREYCRAHQRPQDVPGAAPCPCALGECVLDSAAVRVPRRRA